LTDDSPCREALEQEALAWVNRILAGPLTHEDGEMLSAWRAQSAVHEQAFAEAIRFQRKVRRAIAEERRADSGASVEPLEALRSRRRASGSRARPGGSGRPRHR
jgi:transmembrane sensor